MAHPKLVPPRGREILARERLDERLSAPLVWVCGPPGAGKSTLVADFFHRHKRPCLWYRLDRADSDPATFFYFLGLAAKRRKLPLLTPEYLPGLDVFAQRFFERLPPGVLVFDDYHELAEESPVAGILRGLAGMRPLIVLSRTAPAWAELRLRGELEVIDGADLQLTRDESLALARLKRSGLDPGQVEGLHRSTGGWAAGVRLGLEGGLDDTLDAFFRQTSDPELLPLQLRAALLPRIDAASAAELTGLDNARALLARWYRKGHFLDRAGSAYYCHPLYREWLLAQLASAEDVAALRSRAAGILERAGMLEEARDLYVQAQDWEGLSAWVRSHADSLLRQGRFRALEAALSALPPESRSGDPWLLFWMGASRSLFGPEEALRCFEDAYRRFHEVEDPMGVVLSWSASIDTLVMAGEGWDRMDAWLASLEEVASRLESLPSEMVRAHAISSILLVLTIREPAHPEYAAWAEKAMHWFSRCFDPSTRSRIAISQLFYSILHGRSGDAAAMVEVFRAWASSPEASPFTFLTFKWIEAAYYVLAADPERSLGSAREGLAAAEHCGVHVHDVQLLGNAIQASLNVGDLGVARELFAEMERSPMLQLSRNLEFYHMLRANAALVEGRPREALAFWELSADYPPINPVNLALRWLARVYIAIALEQWAEAESALETFRSVIARLACDAQEFQYRVARSYLGFRRGTREALEWLRSAMELGARHELFGFYMRFPDVLELLCQRALEAGIETAYVRSLITRLGLLPRTPVLEARGWAWPIELRVLGTFELRRQGEPVEFSRKAQARPLSMLRALAAHDDLSEQQITSMLWPDAEGDAGHQLFSVTLHRLRGLLQVKGAVALREGRVSLDPQLCWVDRRAFEGLLAAGELEKAVELYRGELLPGYEGVTAARQRVKSKFLRCSLRLAELRPERAIEVLRRAIELCPLEEELYCRLLAEYRRVGLQAQAVPLFKSLCEVLAEEAGAEPSPATRRLFTASR